MLEGIAGGPPDTSLPGQMMIEGEDEFYDFGTKYLDPEDRMAIPAPIPAAAADEIRRLAAEAFEAVSCEGLARVDFFYTPDGQILINDQHAAGDTPTSYFQKLWEASGLPLASARPGHPDRAGQAPRSCAKAPAGGRRPVGAARRLCRYGWLLADQAPPPFTMALVEPAELRHEEAGTLTARGGRVTGGALRPDGLLEHAEPGDRYLVPPRDRGLDCFQDRVNGLRGGFLVAHPAGNRVDQVTLVHSSLQTVPLPRSRGQGYRARDL